MNLQPAVLLVIEQNKKILLLKRKKGYNTGRWSLPGGKLDEGETLRTTAIREAQEELGIQINQNDLIFAGFVHERYPDKSDRFIFVFKVFSWQGELINKEPDEHEQMNWYAIDILPEPFVPVHREVIAMIQKDTLYQEHNW